MTCDELFSGIVGHASVCRLLFASLQHPASAYLFIGPAHIGKRTLAERYMRGLLELDEQEFLSSHPDFFCLEPLPGKNVISVEQVRDFRERASMKPVRAKRSVMFFPQADRLNEQGMNALLKTIEEPPADAVFILLAEDESRVPKTIQSRCVVLRLQRVPVEQLKESLMKQGKTLDESNVGSKKVRGLPGLLFASEEVSDFQETEDLVRRCLQPSSQGARLAAIESLSKWCEEQEAPLEAWRRVLSLLAQELVSSFQDSDPSRLILGYGVLQAMRSVGSSISPRLALEAAVTQEAVPTLVSHLPRFLPMVYSDPDV